MYFFIDLSFTRVGISFTAILTVCAETIRKKPSLVNVLSALFKIVSKISHLQIVLLRSLLDIYIITVSMVLSARLSQIAEHIGLLIDRRVSKT